MVAPENGDSMRRVRREIRRFLARFRGLKTLGYHVATEDLRTSQAAVATALASVKI